MTEQGYEYVVTKLPTEYQRAKSGLPDRYLTDEINKVAAHGWRLHSIMGKMEFAIFEREK